MLIIATMNIMEKVSNLSSIITLLLFITYIIGRFMTLSRERKLYYDHIIYKLEDDNLFEYDIIEEFFIGKDRYHIALLTSTNGIWDFKLYKKIKDSSNYSPHYQEKDILLYSIPFINIGQSVAIHLSIPDIPNYFVEYISSDYKRITLGLYLNGKNSVESELVDVNHTIKSIIYYLFR